MNLLKKMSYFRIFRISSLICLLVVFLGFSKNFSMESNYNQLRQRKHFPSWRNIEKGAGQEECLNQVVIGNFEDHQLAQENRLYKTVPKEICFGIIDNLDFRDPALVYFFAPTIGITKKQAVQMAFAINNFVIKNVDRFEDIDLKLKAILKTYNKKSQELVLNFITLLDLSFDLEYKNLKKTVGLLPVRWLLYGPSSVQNDVQNLKKEFELTSWSCYECDSSAGFSVLKIKSNLQENDLNVLKNYYSKLKKRILMYEHFGSKKYKKILERYRKNFIRNTLIITCLPTLLMTLLVIVSQDQHASEYFLTISWWAFSIYHSWFVVLDKKSLSDQVVELEKYLVSTENLINLFKKIINSKKMELEDATH